MDDGRVAAVVAPALDDEDGRVGRCVAEACREDAAGCAACMDVSIVDR